MFVCLLLLLLTFSVQVEVTFENCIANYTGMSITNVTIPTDPVLVGQSVNVTFDGSNVEQIYSSMIKGEVYDNATATLQQVFFVDTCRALESNCPCPCSSANVQGSLQFQLAQTVPTGPAYARIFAKHPVSDWDFFCFLVYFTISV